VTNTARLCLSCWQLIIYQHKEKDMIDPRTTAFVFPGQGSQTVGMGKDLALAFPEARDVFQKADSILGFPFSKIMWEGPDTELNDTLNTQPALFIHSMAALTTLKSTLPTLVSAYVAGHSLGELSALAGSGALTFEDGLRLVRKRGELMKRAGEVNPGGMAAILGLDIPTLEKVCSDASTHGEVVQVANDNSPGQVVISGHRPALERAIVAAKAAGARRALPLPVSIASHSPLMASIQAEWDQAVKASACSNAVVPVVGNVHATSMISADELRADIRAQLQSRVRWVDSVKFMTGQGITTFVEIGSGAVLSGLIKRIVEGVTVLPLGAPQDFEALK
jgi:[acyl-carrier-protein] S-malonyltransferase